MHLAHCEAPNLLKELKKPADNSSSSQRFEDPISVDLDLGLEFNCILHIYPPDDDS
jgi:hypothetical protein